MTDSAQGFSAARRLVDLAEAVRADPGLPRTGLTALLARHGENPADLTPGAFTEADAADLRAAARRMADLLAEPDEDRSAEALNALFAQYAARPRLTRHDGHPWHLHVDRGDEAGWGEWFLAAGALALAQLLTEHGRIVWGACAAAGCGRLFLGGGPGSARRYCSGTCATRERVAAHRRRKRAEAGAAGAAGARAAEAAETGAAEAAGARAAAGTGAEAATGPWSGAGR